MLDSLQIKGFKLFRELTVPKLARLNLFVGANNSGKSCLQEAVRLYFAQGNPVVLRDLVRSRDGDREARMSGRSSEGEDSQPSQLQILANIAHTYLAWQDEPGKRLGSAITARQFDSANPFAGHFIQWLCDMFQPSDLELEEQAAQA